MLVQSPRKGNVQIKQSQPGLWTLAVAAYSTEHTVQYITVQYSTAQYSIVHYSTVQHSTVQYSTVVQ